MKKFVSTLSICLGLSMAPLSAASAPQPSVGVVNFSQCLSDSKLGKQEHGSFEALKKQMTALLEDTEKQLNELTAKFNDPEYMDGLSPEAEDELKMKFRTLNEEMSRHQNQYYQVLNQANMKIVQNLGVNIQQAAERVAKDKQLTMVINKEACFFYAPTFDVTNFVISEMDKNFEQESKKQVAAKAEQPAKSKS